ncbi:MAG: hypothetical protein R6U85_08660, partial [Salinivirgaceae bacterium]
IIHLALYILAFAGWQLEKQNIKSTWIYLPYYFISTNLAQLKGLVRYIKKSQSVNWERARRAN